MSDDTTTETVDETSVDTTTTDAATESTTETKPDEAALGDAGKKALDRMKAEKREAEKRAKDAEARIAELEAKAAGKEAEFTAAQEAQRLKDEALSAANERILKANVRAEAASKLNDPQDALRFIDLSEFEVGSDGEVDTSQIAKAIDDLITTKPYLAAQGGKRFQGTADGGARNDATQPSQLTKADLVRMSPEQIDAAITEGRATNLLSGK